MTPDDLRKDADRREALARAAGGQEWSRGCDCRQGAVVRVAAAPGGVVALTLAGTAATFVAANDPLATIASCERDRLLADCVEFIARYFGTEAEGRPSDKLLARFAALEVTGE